MAITPTVLIATTGVLTGKGLEVSRTLQNLVSEINNNPLIVTYNNLASQGFDVSAIPANLHTVLTTSTTRANSSLDQAKAVFGGSTGGTPSSMKSFVSNFSGASSFSSAAAEFAAALNQFQNLSFADLGINIQSYTDVLTNGVTSVSRDLIKSAKTAAAEATLAVTDTLQDVDFTAAEAAADSVASGLKSVGDGLKNFGTVFDFRDLDTLGPANMIRQLQKKGLAQKYGINEYLTSAGYDPNDVFNIPDNVLETTLSFVQGEDKDAIIRETNVQLGKDINNLAQLLVVENVLPPQAMVAMGLIGNAPEMLSKFGNTLSNLGTQLDNFSMAEFLEGVETRALKHLDQLQQLIPTEIAITLKPLLGEGSGPFGNPTIKDMIGVAAGLGYNENFQAVVGTLDSIANTPAGRAVTESADAYNGAVASATSAWEAAGGFEGTGLTLEDYLAGDSEVQITGAAVQSAINAIPGAITSGIEALIENSVQSLVNVAENLAKEVANLAKAGIDLAQSIASSAETTLLSFGNRLHQLGIDKQGIGYQELMDQMVTDDVYGDAIKASLMEGRNLVRNSAVNKPSPTVADEKKEIAKVQSGKLDSLKQEYLSAAARYDTASQKLFSPAGKSDPAVNAEFEAAREARDRARDAMRSAARQSNTSESSLPVYKSPYKNFF